MFALAIPALVALSAVVPQAKMNSNIYDFTVSSIEGKPVKLDKYKGKVLLVVNVASQCGLTPQYKGLQEIYTKYKDKGLVVLGFPANNFGGQEPGTEKEIKQFCETSYGVTFPMFSKVSVKGGDTVPLFKWLIASSDRKDDIEWNFAKFLVGKDGKVLKRFAPRETVDAADVRAAIESALSAK